MDRTTDDQLPSRRTRRKARAAAVRGWPARSLILLLKAVFGGVGAIYLATTSTTITVVAASLAATVTALVLITQR